MLNKMIEEILAMMTDSQKQRLGNEVLQVILALTKNHGNPESETEGTITVENDFGGFTFTVKNPEIFNFKEEENE